MKRLSPGTALALLRTPLYARTAAALNFGVFAFRIDDYNGTLDERGAALAALNDGDVGYSAKRGTLRDFSIALRVAALASLDPHLCPIEVNVEFTDVAGECSAWKYCALGYRKLGRADESIQMLETVVAWFGGRFTPADVRYCTVTEIHPLPSYRDTMIARGLLDDFMRIAGLQSSDFGRALGTARSIA